MCEMQFQFPKLNFVDDSSHVKRTKFKIYLYLEEKRFCYPVIRNRYRYGVRNRSYYGSRTYEWDFPNRRQGSRGKLKTCRVSEKYYERCM